MLLCTKLLEEVDFTQANALRECGFNIGTAYQLADDILDACGNEDLSGKTLGIDQKRGKTTAITAFDGSPNNQVEYIEELIKDSLEILSEWPILKDALEEYLEIEFNPVIKKFVNM